MSLFDNLCTTDHCIFDIRYMKENPTPAEKLETKDFLLEAGFPYVGEDAVELQEQLE